MDWVELYNPTDSVIALEGASLRDYFSLDVEKATPGEYTFSSDTFIEPGEYVVAHRQRGCIRSKDEFLFGLGKTDQVRLFGPGSNEVHSVEWSRIDDGQAVGYFLDDREREFGKLAYLTPGLPNTGELCTCCAACADGRCTRVGDECVARDDNDCAGSLGCQEKGNCVAQAGYCVAGADADCQTSTRCRADGKCSLVADACLPAADADCEGAQVLCQERAVRRSCRGLHRDDGRIVRRVRRLPSQSAMHGRGRPLHRHVERAVRDFGRVHGEELLRARGRKVREVATRPAPSRAFFRPGA